MKLRHLLGGLVSAVLLAGSVQASVVSATGAGVVIDTPSAVTNKSSASNTAIQAFDEVQTYTLTSDLVTDQGVIAAGTTVSSQMVFFNQSGFSRRTLEAAFTFSGTILGTISDSLLLAASDYLGTAGFYEEFALRGIESADTISFSGSTLDVLLNVVQPGDWIRVITVANVAPVPVPAAGLMLPMALGGLVALRRRRKAA